MQLKKIAVVIPVFNGEQTILKSIKSLEKQTFKDWFCIIVNDGSTDKTKEIISGLDASKYLIISFDKNKGRGAARQAALDKIRELKIPYMCMLDADDWYCKNKLDSQFKYMELNLDMTLMSNALGVIDGNGKLFKMAIPFKEYKEFCYAKYSSFIQLPHASSIIRVKDIEGINYNKSFKFSEDLDFLRRILLHKKYSFVPEISYYYNREDSFSILKYRQATLFNIKSFNNLSISSFAKIKYAIVAIAKYCFVLILSIFGIEKYYLNKIGISPTKENLLQFNEANNNIFGIKT